MKWTVHNFVNKQNICKRRIRFREWIRNCITLYKCRKKTEQILGNFAHSKNYSFQKGKKNHKKKEYGSSLLITKWSKPVTQRRVWHEKKPKWLLALFYSSGGCIKSTLSLLTRQSNLESWHENIGTYTCILWAVSCNIVLFLLMHSSTKQSNTTTLHIFTTDIISALCSVRIFRSRLMVVIGQWKGEFTFINTVE